MKQFEINTIKSFNLAKSDIHRLYSLIAGLQAKVADLDTLNGHLIERVNSLSKPKRKSRVVVRKTKSAFIASKVGSKFHSTKCAFAKNIKPKNRVKFGSKNTALNKGLKRCACVQ